MDSISPLDFDHLVYCVGMGLSKQEISRLFKSGMVDKFKAYRARIRRKYNKKVPHSPLIPGEVPEENEKPFPVFLSHLNDGCSFSILTSAYRKYANRKRFSQIFTDKPYVTNIYIDAIWVRPLRPNLKAAIVDSIITSCRFCGIRALSEFLWHLNKKARRRLSYQVCDEKEALLFRDDKTKGDDRMQKELSEEQVDADYLITSLIQRAASHHLTSNRGKTKAQADIEFALPFCRTVPERWHEIYIGRYISIPMIRSFWNKTLIDAQSNTCFITIGGPEHNKLLEYFLLHKVAGKKSPCVDDISNRWAQKDAAAAMRSRDLAVPRVLLACEGYVGAELFDMMSEQCKRHIIKRLEDKALIFNFQARITLDKGIIREFPVFSIVGFSAVNSSLALAYLLLCKKKVKPNSLDILSFKDDRYPEENLGSDFFIKRYLIQNDIININPLQLRDKLKRITLENEIRNPPESNEYMEISNTSFALIQ
jgi:hypothetical protein